MIVWKINNSTLLVPKSSLYHGRFLMEKQKHHEAPAIATLTAQNICKGVCTAAGRSGAHVPEVPEGKRQGGRRNDKNHGVGFLRRFWRNQEGFVANCIPSFSITCPKKKRGVSWNWRTIACLLGFAAAGYFVLPVEVVQQFSSTAESVLGLVRVIAASLAACQNNTPHKCS